MSAFVSRFLDDQSGATAIEYGLIAALIAVFLITALETLRDKMGNTFDSLSTDMK